MPVLAPKRAREPSRAFALAQVLEIEIGARGAAAWMSATVMRASSAVGYRFATASRLSAGELHAADRCRGRR